MNSNTNYLWFYCSHISPIITFHVGNTKRGKWMHSWINFRWGWDLPLSNISSSVLASSLLRKWTHGWINFWLLCSLIFVLPGSSVRFQNEDVVRPCIVEQSRNWEALFPESWEISFPAILWVNRNGRVIFSSICMTRLYFIPSPKVWSYGGPRILNSASFPSQLVHLYVNGQVQEAFLRPFSLFLQNPIHIRWDCTYERLIWTFSSMSLRFKDYISLLLQKPTYTYDGIGRTMVKSGPVWWLFFTNMHMDDGLVRLLKSTIVVDKHQKYARGPSWILDPQAKLWSTNFRNVTRSIS